MEMAMEEARKMGKRRVLLGMHPENARALAFYEKAGFRVMGTRTFRMGFNTYEDLVLASEAL
jgi:ribosomal protein S18 acetylase RimI-like enzyme